MSKSSSEQSRLYVHGPIPQFRAEVVTVKTERDDWRRKFLAAEASLKRADAQIRSLQSALDIARRVANRR
jgi:hypothetical protein